MVLVVKVKSNVDMYTIRIGVNDTAPKPHDKHTHTHRA